MFRLTIHMPENQESTMCRNKSQSNLETSQCQSKVRTYSRNFITTTCYTRLDNTATRRPKTKTENGQSHTKLCALVRDAKSVFFHKQCMFFYQTVHICVNVGLATAKLPLRTNAADIVALRQAYGTLRNNDHSKQFQQIRKAQALAYCVFAHMFWTPERIAVYTNNVRNLHMKK